MSDAVTLSLAARPEHVLVADCIAADRFAGLDAKQIAALPVVHGGRPGTLGEFFKIRGERSSVVRIEGDLAQVDARGNAGDNAGGALPGAARGMTGGEIIVRGNVGDEAGARMRRGMIAVTGA